MRGANWPANLAQLIERRRHAPFAWGSNDCLIFANDAYQAVTGSPLCADWLGGYNSAAAAVRLYRDAQAACRTFEGQTPKSTIVDALDSRLKRYKGAFPPRGFLVARVGPAGSGMLGHALGVSLGAKMAFLGLTGLVFLPPDPTDIFWAVE